MATRPHHADAADREAIARAVGFEACLFLGSGKWARSPRCATLVGARSEANCLEAAHPRSGRKAMIYAMVPHPNNPSRVRGVHVPDDYQQPQQKGVVMSIKTYTNRSNTQRAAKAALGGDAVSGVDFEIYEHKTGQFAWRSKGAAKETSEAKQSAPTTKAAPAKAPRQKKERPLSKRAAAEAAAREGKLPEPPDFSAETHKRYRGKLDELKALVKKGDIKGLKAYPINPTSTSPKALDRYRNLAVTAVLARDSAKS